MNESRYLHQKCFIKHESNSHRASYSIFIGGRMTCPTFHSLVIPEVIKTTINMDPFRISVGTEGKTKRVGEEAG